MIQAVVSVQENVRLARDTFRIRLHCPSMARRFRPGQFLMLRTFGSSDPLLGRPFALYDIVLDSNDEPDGVDIVYLCVGKLTRKLATVRAGDALEVWGPLGNGFPDLENIEHVGLVAGGIGQTPFLAYTKFLLGRRAYNAEPPRRRAARVSLYYGVRNADFVAGLDDFHEAGAAVHLASDDGSVGFQGLVTELLGTHAPPQHLIGCGPAPMMKAVARLARTWQLPCHLSLESPMACGIGICFSCVALVQTPKGADYRRICMEGPVFDAADLIWTE